MAIIELALQTCLVAQVEATAEEEEEAKRQKRQADGIFFGNGSL